MPIMAARIVSPEEGLDEAVFRLQNGELVAFPTETVYGLGANGLNESAVRKIFMAKGRPATNPIIVHIPDVETAKLYVSEWPAIADELAAKFWPGALTLVVKKNPNIPDIVTAGGETVGLRVPNHPVALELLRRTGLPIAAPSANRSEEVSPTSAQHVLDSLGDFVEDLLILDGGFCHVGLESTVLDVTENPPRILRPGMVTTFSLEKISETVKEGAKGKAARSPGQQKRHYAPQTRLQLMPSILGHIVKISPNEGLITWGKEKASGINIVEMPDNPEESAALLYATLRELDSRGLKRIWVNSPPNGSQWKAIHDRLERAAAPKQPAIPTDE